MAHDRRSRPHMPEDYAAKLSQARSRRSREARHIVEFIAANISESALKEAFLAKAQVREILKAS